MNKTANNSLKTTDNLFDTIQQKASAKFRYNKTILTSQYKLYLPTESQLLAELKKELENEYLGGAKNE